MDEKIKYRTSKLSAIPKSMTQGCNEKPSNTNRVNFNTISLVFSFITLRLTLKSGQHHQSAKIITTKLETTWNYN